MSQRDHVLQLDNITMQFGGVVAVNNLSMEVNEGEIVALIGPNGAGKTTCFNVITGVYQPSNGQVSFYDKPYVRNHPQGKMKKLYKGEDPTKYLGYVIAPTPDHITKMGIARTFQNIRLWKSMTVFDNVIVAKHMRANQNLFSSTFRVNRKEEARMRAETESLLREQGLWKHRDDLATSLPYGLQRRLEIARCMVTQPEILMLDEPAAGLNPKETKELDELIAELRDSHDTTILLIEHDMKLVMGISDRIYVVNQGTPLANGTPEEIRNNPDVIRAYLGEA